MVGIGTESRGEREQGRTAQLLLSFYLTWRVVHAFMNANLSTKHVNSILAFMDLLTLWLSHQSVIDQIL